MRRNIHSRKRDQQRDCQESQADSPARKDKRREKCRRGGGMARWKRMKARTKSWSGPARFRLDAWPGAPGRYFYHARRDASKGARQNHRRKNPRPLPVSTPVRDGKENEPQENVTGPVAQPAHPIHEMFDARVLMARHPFPRAGIEVEASHDQQRGAQKNQTPPPERRDRSKLAFVFHPALSLNLGSATRNPQFHCRFSRRPPFARRRDLDDPACRPGRASFCRGIARDAGTGRLGHSVLQ